MASISEIKSKIVLNEMTIDTKVTDTSSPYKSLEEFRKNLKIEIKHCSDEEIEFDLIGLDASLANAYRRIMIAEVPSMAIEKVYMMNNTSIMPDEVLAHRMGLIPILADARLFNYPQYNDNKELIPEPSSVLEFELNIKCTNNPKAPADAKLADEKYINSNVYSRHLKWIPLGNQADTLKEVKTCQDDILIMKLRPGQEIQMRLHCVKGIGKDHAKFSPVSVASYRMMPAITLLEPIKGAMAKKLQECFTEGVIGIKVVDGEKVAFVADARPDTQTREALRHKELRDRVELTRVPNHFIFTVESTGVLPAADIFTESVKILMGKCDYFMGEMDKRT